MDSEESTFSLNQPWMGFELESPDLVTVHTVTCCWSNFWLFLDFWLEQVKMPLLSTGFLTQLYSLWKPSWLTSQPFLQFILNYKNHPNLAAPVHHTRGTHKKHPHHQSSIFWIKVSSLTGLYTADCSEETKQQESNETVSYRQFGTIW